MDLKKIMCIMLSTVFVVLSVITASASEQKENFARVYFKMPNIVAEINQTNLEVDDLNSIIASYGDNKFKVDACDKYDPAKHSTKAYMLVDMSVSMANYMDDIKGYIKKFAGNMGANDSMVLMTFGTDTKYLLDGNESIDEINAVVDSIKPTANETALYDALYQVYNDSVNKASNTQNAFTREYVITFTDCENWKNFSVTGTELEEKYKTHQLPLYVAPISAEYEEYSNHLGKIARASGGFIQHVYNMSEFDDFTDEIDKVTIIKMTEENNDNNVPEGSVSLYINIIGNEYSINLETNNSQTDSVPPEVLKAEYDVENRRFIIKFSEKVNGINEKGAYRIFSGDRKWTISTIEAINGSDKAELLMVNDMPNGKYTIKFEGIKDTSRQSNPLKTNDIEVTVTGSVASEGEETVGLSTTVIVLIIVGSLVFVGLIIFVLILIISKDRKKDDSIAVPVINHSVPNAAGGTRSINEYEQAGAQKVKHHIKSADSVRVRLRIKTGKTSEQNIEISITSSIIVGRSSACDVYVDDTKMSRQHFIIENIDHELYVSDANSKNGTFVNGTNIVRRRKIMNEDKIFAGLSEISISYME